MKRTIAALVFFLPLSIMAQGNWERPTTDNNYQGKEKKIEKKTKEKKSDEKYMEKDAVPEVDGKVAWIMDVEVPGTTAQQNYDKMYDFLNRLVKGKNQLEDSNVSIVNNQEHKIAASIREWLVFHKTFYDIDRAKFQYTLLTECYDNRVKITLNRIKYFYDERPNKTTLFSAEELITDKYAMNKAKTKLVRPGAKFRRKTIDRKNELLNKIKTFMMSGEYIED